MHYNLPKNLIAQRPAEPRDSARLLVYNRQTKELVDDYFYNLDKHLTTSTTLVVNNSKVDKCRYIFGEREVFVLEKLPGLNYKALVRPGHHFKLGSKIEYGNLKLKVGSVEPDGTRILSSNMNLYASSLERYRKTPFPPYIKASEKLAGSYQTVYAGPLGSKAAPTAGLHFSPKLLNKLKKKHQIAEVTLHIGLGTFLKPTKAQIESKKLHSEPITISSKTAEMLNSSKHITAVGTTSLRALETVRRPFKAYSGETDIFIQQGYQFNSADALITNFHLPGSSLLMLVSAFIGSDIKTLEIYHRAINNNYRFYSFGDAMLIL